MARYLSLVNGIQRMVDFTVYDQTLVVSGTITAGTNFTLPASGTYTGNDLKVHLDGQFLEPAIDYNYVGSGVRTQIQLTFDVTDGERLRFRREP